MRPLTDYNRKRDFRRTPEPSGKTTKEPRRKREREPLVFVVQKHHASHLHYDFRLEVDGVLKSWAVPKGPSMDPKLKRLAVEVEDHPLEYASFEGDIPENQYGAGHVEIWDHGTWEPESNSKEALKKGKLEFTLKGRRLRGKWILIRTKSPDRSKPQWLLFKRKDGKTKVAAEGLTHPQKVFFPEEGWTKGDVASYYRRVAEWMIPHLKGRPLSIKRCPQGVAGKCFFQKHHSASFPEAIEPLTLREKTGERLSMTVHSTEGLVGLTQMGAFELHTGQGRKPHLEKPDQVVMDFDPGSGVPWLQVVQAAVELRAMLTALGLRSFVNTTGGKGLHVHIPMKPEYGVDQVKDFAETLARQLAARHPKLFTLELSKKLRAKKIFIDFLRNGPGATSIAPYSLRARETSSVAMPVEWGDLADLKSGADFNMDRALKHLTKRKKDPWKDFFKVGKSQSLPLPDTGLFSPGLE